MKTIHVNASKSYDILIERGILDRAGEEIKTVCGAGEALIVSDDTVWDLYGETVLASMQKAGFDVTSFTFPHGEQSKNLSVYADILNALAARHLHEGFVDARCGELVDLVGLHKIAAVIAKNSRLDDLHVRNIGLDEIELAHGLESPFYISLV